MRRHHAGVLLVALFLLDAQEAHSETDSAATAGNANAEFEFFPILSYDTDVGFGYGAKGFLLNSLGTNESFDLTLFNSSKGERWYRFVFSFPDLERRQGTAYTAAFDLIIDYDKLISASFFGIGNGTRFDDREFYTKEPLDVSLTFSRGFSQVVVGQLGVRFKATRNFNFESGSTLRALPPSFNSSRAAAFSVFINARYDTRNSYINATDGTVLLVECETAPTSGANEFSFFRLAGWIQHYRAILPDVVFALRGGVSEISGDELPVQFLLPVGGGNTVRGSPQDRLLDRVSAVVNLECRFPILPRLGGVVGADAGQVWHRIREAGLAGWKANLLAGLRFSMDTFIVRLDVGLGLEATGFYLNFGQLF